MNNLSFYYTKENKNFKIKLLKEMNQPKIDVILEKLYYSPKTGYIGIEALWNKARELQDDIKRKDVKQWMDQQQVRQLNKTTGIKPKFMPIFSNEGESYQIDLTFLPKFKKQNHGYDIMMTCININTRKGYAYMAKNKEQNTIVDLLDKLFEDTNKRIHTITSDNGTEFLNRKVQKFFDEHNITHITGDAGDKFKLGKIERFNRTIKMRIENHFLATNTVVWYDVLDDILRNYNDTIHSAIKMKPNDVGIEEEKQIVDDALEKVHDILKNNQVLSSPVRIRLKKEIFDKGTQLWSEDLYDIIDTTLMGRYRVRKIDSKVPLKKTFRFEELQEVLPVIQTYKAESDISVRGKDTGIIEVNTTTENRGKLNALREAKKLHKDSINLKKVGINLQNIVTGKRDRKKKEILSL
jgi:hypothetical protein